MAVKEINMSSKHLEVLKTIRRLRTMHSSPYHYYINGGCGIFANGLKQFHPDGELVHDATIGHVYLKIGNYYYDVHGARKNKPLKDYEVVEGLKYKFTKWVKSYTIEHMHGNNLSKGHARHLMSVYERHCKSKLKSVILNKKRKTALVELCNGLYEKIRTTRVFMKQIAKDPSYHTLLHGTALNMLSLDLSLLLNLDIKLLPEKYGIYRNTPEEVKCVSQDALLFFNYYKDARFIKNRYSTHEDTKLCREYSELLRYKLTERL